MLGSDYGEEEVEAAVRAIRSSMDPIVGFGYDCEEILAFEAEFASYCGTEYAVTTNGAGTGLDMSMMALSLEPGDEVICPTINFRGALMAILGQGGKLVLCESDAKTLNADPNDAERRITSRTRAFLITHMNGLSFPVDDFVTLAERYPHPRYGPLKVIGDAARACGGRYNGTRIGKKGWMNVFSFHTAKNMTTLGEGGAVTTDDPDLVPRLKASRQFGWDGWGSNYKMTKVQAAVGSVQLKRLDGLVASRRRLAHERTRMLEGCPGLQLPHEPAGYLHSYYLYSILVAPDWAGEKRDRLIQMMKDLYGVGCVVANPPVHQQVPYVARFTQGQDLPVSLQIGQRLFCPPIHPRMSDEDNEYIAAAVWDVVERIAGEG